MVITDEVSIFILVLNTLLRRGRAEDNPKPVLTVSPLWLSPGDSVTLNCSVTDPSAGWRFYWYKAVPKQSNNSYSYELLPGRINGTEQDFYIVHGQTHTAGYVCRAGGGEPMRYTRYSKLRFVWSGDSHSASVKVSPDRVQHFSSESVSLSCEGNFAKWRVMRFTGAGHLSSCSDWGTVNGPTCNIHRLKNKTAVFWCESGSGQFSNAVNITGQNKDIILVSPVHPVTEGGSFTLGCKLKKGTFDSNVHFYRDDDLIQNNDRAELNISSLSKSDEGLYKCQCSGKASPRSWMSVKSVSRRESSSFLLPLIIGLVCGISLISLLLMLCCYRKSKDSCCARITQSQRTNQDSAPDRVVNQNETQPQVQSSYLHDADESSDVTYSLIQFKNIRKKGQRNEPEESCVYSDVKQLQKNHILQ
ncbi:uncharacterized protein LOC119481365 [Sebastes umbrosus]|uniref:uncharacterized protein LOC119481365 n=1 Tax=Sebastes umbrosus TaxID=72105 RepID=UPI0018A0019F|nr:uncharacterized protein LOC119481365 [Sebastes umbrosus]